VDKLSVNNGSNVCNIFFNVGNMGAFNKLFKYAILNDKKETNPTKKKMLSVLKNLNDQLASRFNFQVHQLHKSAIINNHIF
jgi:hypothetical protein